MAKAKQILGLRCEASAAEGMQLVLRTRLQEMCASGKTALGWTDPKDVHDFRIALRRLRSAVKDFKPYLKMRKLSLSLQSLKRMAKALSSVRDQDVMIAMLEKLLAEAPPELTDSIQHFVDESRREREVLFEELLETADDKTLASLQRNFSKEIELLAEDKDEEAFRLSFGEAGKKIINARLKELREAGAGIYRPFKTKQIYRIRVKAKRLRYALELFASCGRRVLIESHAKEIAELQMDLGKLHDCDIAIRMLTSWLLEQERGNAEIDSDSLEARQQAVIWLLIRLTKSHTEQFSKALILWHEWMISSFEEQLITSLEKRRVARRSKPYLVRERQTSLRRAQG